MIFLPWRKKKKSIARRTQRNRGHGGGRRKNLPRTITNQNEQKRRSSRIEPRTGSPTVRGAKLAEGAKEEDNHGVSRNTHGGHGGTRRKKGTRDQGLETREEKTTENTE